MESSAVDNKKYSKQYAYDLMNKRKAEIVEDIKNGGADKKIQTGGAAYSKEDWERLLKKVDTNLKEIKETQKEQKEQEEKAAAQHKPEDSVKQLYKALSMEATTKASKLLQAKENTNSAES